MKLTKTRVNQIALSKGDSDKIFFDDELTGFGLRVRKGGSRKWVLYYRQAGIQRRYTIGSAASMDVDEARRRARKVLVTVDDGGSPAIEKASKRTAAALTVSAVADDFLRAQGRLLKLRSFEETRRHLIKHWRPLHGLALTAVGRALVAAHLRGMAESSGPIAANRARSALSAMFSWAIGEGLCDINPVTGTNKAGEEKLRGRVLSDAELVVIWKAAPSNAYGRVVRLLMLTAQRREEIGGLRWSEVVLTGKAHLDNGVQPPMIALSAERTKNCRLHSIPLSAAAVAVIKAQPRIVGRDIVFGAGERGFSNWSKSKAALDTACGVKNWRLHDLRRSVATRMADLGVQPHVIEAVLNPISEHKAGVAGIYIRASYAAEKRAALDLWANHLQVAIAKSDGTNAVKIAKTRA
jgi:integrase